MRQRLRRKIALRSPLNACVPERGELALPNIVRPFQRRIFTPIRLNCAIPLLALALLFSPLCKGGENNNNNNNNNNWTPTARQLQNTAVETPGSVDLTATAGNAIITIDKTTTRQEIWGFGAAITKPAKNFLNDLSAAHQKEVYDLFFLNEAGNIGLTIVRMQIYPEGHTAPGVYDWKANALYQDQFAREAYKRYPAPVIAAPWSPPAWMKTTNSLKAKDSALKPDRYDALSQWLYDWTQYRRDHLGLDVRWLSIQNEPDAASVAWDGCNYTPKEMEKALLTTLKLFRSKGSTVMVGGPDCGNDKSAQDFLDAMSKDTVSSMDWIAHHGYKSIRQPQNDLDFRKYHKPVLMTELCGGTLKQTGGQNDDITDGLMWAAHIQRALSRDEKGYIYWQLMRDSKTNQSLMELKTGKDYYHPFKRAFVFANYSRFMRPGYIVVKSSSNNGGVLVTAAKHPSTGNTSVVMANTAKTDITVTINGLAGNTIGGRITNAQYNFESIKDIAASGGKFTIRIPARSVVSIAEK